MAVPEIGIKQITTGFRKWSLRYLYRNVSKHSVFSNYKNVILLIRTKISCRGQQVNQYQIARMDRWRQTLTAKYIYFKNKQT